MSNLRRPLSALALLSVATLIIPGIATADSISPYVEGDANSYSSERPDTANFGTGTGSRQAEASYLRFIGQQDIENGHFDTAIKHLGKALLLDASDPENHLLYARAMTAKLLQDPEHMDREALDKTIREWRMLWHHDADIQEQLEGRREALKLTKIAKALDKAKTVATSVHANKISENQLVVEKVITPKGDE